MAGNYPSPTARRINYDLNGTRCWYKTANAASTPLTEDGSFMVNMNNESTGTVPVVTLAWNGTTNPGHPPFILLKFPTPMDITGIKIFGGSLNAVSLAVSNDTTNGVDGTWTAGTNVTPASGVQKEWSRSGTITPQTFVGVQYLRLSLSTAGGNGNKTLGKVLIYDGASTRTDTLDFWDATLDQPAAPDLFEFGDRPRGTSASRQFRIKNLSETMKAVDISVTRSITTDASPSVPGFHLFSLDEITWIGSLSLGDLDPEEISPVITLKQDVPTDAALWLWQITVTAIPNTWEAP